MNIISYIILELGDEELNVKKIIAVVDATLAVVKIRLTNQLNDQLLVGLLACWLNWLEHCTEVKGSNPVQA